MLLPMVLPIVETCMSALNMGLSFAPTSNTNDSDTIIDFQKFFCTLRFREFIQSNDYVPPGERQGKVNMNERPSPPMTCLLGKPIKLYRKKSTLPPRGRNASLKTYCQLVDHDVGYDLSLRQHATISGNMFKTYITLSSPTVGLPVLAGNIF